MSTETPEAAKELALIGKVELRIALMDSDPKLETTLKTYLCPLLLKLASEHVSVRNKVRCVFSSDTYSYNGPTRVDFQARGCRYILFVFP